MKTIEKKTKDIGFKYNNTSHSMTIMSTVEQDTSRVSLSLQAGKVIKHLFISLILEQTFTIFNQNYP